MNTNRKLARIEIINNIEPIENADFIVKATVNGWNVVVKKDEFAVGDYCVFFEIDSFLPNEEVFSFLGEDKLKEYNGRKGYRLKTQKMRGVVSQGLALPLRLFPKFYGEGQGEDLTERLDVIKYDVQIADKSGGLLAGNTAGRFPDFLPKTDQERIQNKMNYFTKYEGIGFEETLKLDGSSMTCYKVKKELTKFQEFVNKYSMKFLKKEFYKSVHFGVCSRNLELKRPENGTTSDFWYAAEKYRIENTLPVGYAVQGELIGPKIQKNHEKVQDIEFYVFDIFNITEQRYLSPHERKLMMKELSPLKHVPIINERVEIFNEYKTLEDLLKRVDTESMNKGTISEGRVYKSYDGKFSFKCINNRYLLKCED